MKTFGRNFFPELHVNPINRDLVIVLFAGLMLALGVGTVVALIVFQL